MIELFEFILMLAPNPVEPEYLITLRGIQIFDDDNE